MKLEMGDLTDIQSCPTKLPPLFRAPAVWGSYGLTNV